ncbi:hypothetical protein Pint_22601 [Pistacia integerrima]|uniref:Uncharacterized protein n=1 Tax=Pistacia integerrima TaxID=434235 RepID=A0ACC0YP01_9ROSI|nr:hypothetical protein Pint_22601 [Pistacia integerrima]
MSSASLNVSNFVTLRLRPENYQLWREQVLALAESQELTYFLIEENPCPVVVLPALDGNNPTANPAYKHWKTADRLLRGWIIGTLAEEALSHVIGLDTSAQVWAALKEAYAQSKDYFQ